MLQKQQGLGGILDYVQTWLNVGDEACDVALCARSQYKSRSRVSSSPSRPPPTRSAPMGCESASTGNVETRKQELEAALQRDLERLAEERKEGLHRIDWQLAEAVENLHAETVERANQRIKQHKDMLANLENHSQSTEPRHFGANQRMPPNGFSSQTNAQGRNRFGTNSDVVAGSSGEDATSSGGGSEDDPGVWDHLLNLFQKTGVGADGGGGRSSFASVEVDGRQARQQCQGSFGLADGRGPAPQQRGSANPGMRQMELHDSPANRQMGSNCGPSSPLARPSPHSGSPPPHKSMSQPREAGAGGYPGRDPVRGPPRKLYSGHGSPSPSSPLGSQISQAKQGSPAMAKQGSPHARTAPSPSSNSKDKPAPPPSAPNPFGKDNSASRNGAASFAGLPDSQWSPSRADMRRR